MDRRTDIYGRKETQHFVGSSEPVNSHDSLSYNARMSGMREECR